MSDDRQSSDALMRAVIWEWRAALITIGVATVLVAAAIGFFFWERAQQVAEIQRQIEAQQQAQKEQEAQQKALAAAALQFCTVALGNAKSYGIVPAYGALASGPKVTDKTGRYICTAATNIAHYNIAADFVCRDLKNVQCVNIYSVTQDDGTMLYQRQSK